MEEDIQRSLIHSSECTVEPSECCDDYCSEIKRRLEHYKNVPVGHFCHDCLEVVDMCTRHAIECGRGHNCTVPFCAAFRRRVDTSLTRPPPDVVERLARDLDANVAKAAHAVCQADVLLVLTGAGYSSDSGLPVYKDIASVPAYREAGLSYQDLCQPEWIETDIEVFYGFWGTCFNQYRAATPHAGYSILRRWTERRFAVNSAAQEVKLFVNSILSEQRHAPLPSSTLPSAFFSITSNVDDHFRGAGFPASCLWEIHGNTETWQCSLVCTDNVWNAPKGYRFRVDESTMRAPPGPPESAGVGDCLGFETNHPTCRYCRAPARPAILFFGDTQYLPDEAQRLSFARWMEAVRGLASVRPLSLVLIEIGAGIRVPTIRDQSHAILRMLRKHATLIRINPDFPVAPSDVEGQTISIMANGLRTLQQIDDLLQKLDRRFGGDYQPPLASASLGDNFRAGVTLGSPGTRTSLTEVRRGPPRPHSYSSSSPYLSMSSPTTLSATKE